MRKTTQKPFRFTYVHLGNWRNFTLIDAALQRRVFLVGPNASGKSNFLDVFRFLHDLVAVGGGLQEAVRKRGGVSRLRCLAARRRSDITVLVRVGSDEAPTRWEYELCFNQDARSRPVIRRERVVRDGAPILTRPDDQDRADPERLTQTYLEQVYVNQAFRELAEFLPTVQYLHIVPQLVREPDRSVGRANDPFGGDFLEKIASAQEKTRTAWLRRIRDALRVAVPQLQELELWRDARGTPHLRGKYEHWRPQGAWQTEDQFSDGTLRLMGLLWIALAGSGPLLLEEPELSLHPDVVRHIPQMFARMQRRTGRQVFLSTHSPDMLRDRGIGLDEVLLLQPSREGTTVRPAGQIDQSRQLLKEGLTLADIVIPHTRPERAEQLTVFGD
ncbi:MAG: AAA family ATPase [Thermoguttaceae bacterium]|jgi:predicted ATPase|nr:AAA family ATPase [Thermoguttaceae bacterium]